MLIAGIVLFALILLGGGYAAKQTFFNKPTPAPTPSPNSGINLDPPTEEDKKETEQNKDNLAEDLGEPGKPTATPTETSSGKKRATVVVTYAGQYNSAKDLEVGAYIENVFEDQGTCTLTVNGPGGSITKQTTGARDVSKTLCPAFTVPRAELSPGTWTLSVTYDSDTSNGISGSQELTIQ